MNPGLVCLKKLSAILKGAPPFLRDVAIRLRKCYPFTVIRPILSLSGTGDFSLKSAKMKFILGGMLVLVALVWLGFVGFEESKAYYITVQEYDAARGSLDGKTLKVAGEVAAGSIDRTKPQLEFVIESQGKALRVRYVGKDIIPDTFKDGSKALIEGKASPDGIFQAQRIEAKCASKYEAEYDKRSS
jgi:cytochrome c-type biogenesis protein CcmE